MRRMILGVLLIVIGLLWVMPVWGQDGYPAKCNEVDADLAYQKMLQKIEETQENGGDALYFCNVALKALPPEIGQLKHLTILELSTPNLESFPAEIGQLSNLTSIYLSANLLTLPPEIGHLKQLTSIQFHSNLPILPPEIFSIASLEYLHVTGTPLTSLSPDINKLVNLKLLDISDTQITLLPPEIGQLVNLETLDMHKTPITRLPIELGRLEKLEYVSLIYDPPLTFPPPDIMAQSRPAILAYLRDYEAMLMRQTIAAIATGIGAIAGLLLLFRWRQRHGLTEKKKRA